MDTWKVKCTQVFNVGIAFSGFMTTFFTIIDVTCFLSNPDYGLLSHKKEAVNVPWTWALIVNSMLLSIFVLQHSLLALQPVKDFFSDYGMKDVQRSIYIILTCIALQFLVRNWHYTENIVIWEVPIDHFYIVHWLFLLAHAISWILIYIGSICLDINELLGLKQVYYSLLHLPEPIKYKTAELRSLYSHMRHPSFLGFVIIFWFIPVMRLDRLVLAGILTLYMYITWKTDDSDFLYQKSQMSRKFH